MSAGNKGMVFLAGLCLGTFFGAAGAVLMAPCSGSRLRSSIATEAKKLAVKASEMVPEEWSQIAEEERSKTVLENMSNIRSAGL